MKAILAVSLSLFASLASSAVIGNVRRAPNGWLGDQVLQELQTKLDTGMGDPHVASMVDEEYKRNPDFPHQWINQRLFKWKKFQGLEMFPDDNVRIIDGPIPAYIKKDIAGWTADKAELLAGSVIEYEMTEAQHALLKNAYVAQNGPADFLPPTLDAMDSLKGSIRTKLVQDILNTDLPDSQMRNFLRAYSMIDGDVRVYWTPAEIAAYETFSPEVQIKLLKIALLAPMDKTENVFDILSRLEKARLENSD